jgi:hypothetical protein
MNYFRSNPASLLQKKIKIRFAQKIFQSISGNFFSIDPSPPAWNFSIRPCRMSPDPYAGEKDLLLDNYPTVG